MVATVLTEEENVQAGTYSVIEREGLQCLFEVLEHRGYRLLGPQVREGVIVYDELSSADDLPVGWTDEQEGGVYRLVKGDSRALFNYAASPHSWKQFLHPPVLRLWRAEREGDTFQMQEEKPPPGKSAFIGVRACDLSAIAIQDRVFLDGPYVDTQYQARREGVFIVAVNCGKAGATCFCASMGTGPKAEKGYDLALTEVLDADEHFFIIETGSSEGAGVLAELPHRAASDNDLDRAEAVLQRTVRQMGRSMDTVGLKELLYVNPEHPRWEEVAQRCLACGNCTQVCPTCFCTNVEDVTDLAGKETERWRKWDSCFMGDFSYIHGGNVRASRKSRYRQWLTHKLGTWQDQFGTTGCVGCGRCITWCPVGIDITEEVRAIRSAEPALVVAGENQQEV